MTIQSTRRCGSPTAAGRSPRSSRVPQVFVEPRVAEKLAERALIQGEHRVVHEQRLAGFEVHARASRRSPHCCIKAAVARYHAATRGPSAGRAARRPVPAICRAIGQWAERPMRRVSWPSTRMTRALPNPGGASASARRSRCRCGARGPASAVPSRASGVEGPMQPLDDQPLQGDVLRGPARDGLERLVDGSSRMSPDGGRPLRPPASGRTPGARARRFSFLFGAWRCCPAATTDGRSARTTTAPK